MARIESSKSLDSVVARVMDAIEAMERHPESTIVEKNAAAVCHMAMEPVFARVNSRILGCRMVGATDKIAHVMAALARGVGFGGRA